MQYAVRYETKLPRSLMTPSGHYLLKIIPTARLHSAAQSGSRSADKRLDHRPDGKMDIFASTNM